MTEPERETSKSATQTGSIVLQTERLIVRELALPDAPFILDLLTQPSFVKYIGDRGVYDLATAEQYIVDVQSQYREIGYGSYGVVLKETGNCIGISGLIKRPSLPHPDIGFAYHPDYWRQGFATEGSAALLAYAEQSLGLDTVIAMTSPINTASQKLLEKLGLKFQRRMTAEGKADDSLIYAPDK